MPISLDDFASHVGTAYRVVPTGGEPLAMTLRACERLADSGRDGGSFRLEFAGPLEPRLPQSIYGFTRNGGDPVEIFIVPIAAEPDAMVYEAIFY